MKIGFIRGFWMPLAVEVLVSLYCPAWALTGIHNELWIPSSGGLRYRDSFGNCTNLTVQFEATVTFSDAASGIHFSICERDAGESNDPLLELKLPPRADWPIAGTHVLMYVDFRLGCGSAGELIGCRVSSWSMTWCDADSTHFVEDPASTDGTSFTSNEPEDFELVLVDDEGVEGPNPTIENAFHCTSASVWAPVTTSGRGPAPWRQAAGVPMPAETADAPPLIAHDPAENGSIGIYFDREGLICGGDMVVGVPARLYVVVRLDGWTRCGIAGAEFRIVGMPAGWFVGATAEGRTIEFGNPLTGGVTAGFVCRHGEHGAVVLYTIDIFPTTEVSNHQIGIEMRQPPISPFHPCTLVTLCNGYRFTITCVEGSDAVINPSGPTKCDVPSVPVQMRNWSQVKELYRD